MICSAARSVFVNAAGCMTLLSVYPFTPFRGSWLYTAMASAPAGAQGVRDALDILIEQGRMPPEEDLQVVLTGDGSAYGMGLSATSAAIERGLDFLYIVYDNEGYGNTGQQTSAATPHGARTSTCRGRRLRSARRRICSRSGVPTNPLRGHR
jgi:pyruvate ferredoxin oxidoreductase beta subunit